MNFTFLCLVITQYWLACRVYAVYNKDVVCIIDKGSSPVCQTSRRFHRRSTINNIVPSHDPYIPRLNTLFFDCSAPECVSVDLRSITQLTSPSLVLKSCFQQLPSTYECETIRYNYFKNIDKLLFLTTNINDKAFYMVDCLVYSDGGRVCHKKVDDDSYPKLIDTGTMARPMEDSILSQDEFICEEGIDKEVHCDLDPFTPFDSGLKLKEKVRFEGDILLKTGPYMVVLKRDCIGSWCGFTGRVAVQTRRVDTRYPYEPPGGWIYTCYYAKKQQICKPLYNPNKPHYNERDWIADD